MSNGLTGATAEIKGGANGVDAATEHVSGSGTGTTEEPALAEAGAERAGDLELLDRLDALGQEHGAGAFGLGVDGVDDRGDGG